MGTYAIGDVQGCFITLSRLLERIQFDPAADRIWIAGDLVNRGPDSLGVLRWASSLGSTLVAVLGNHDLHLLARAEGVRRPRKRDTLDAVLDASDRGELLDWLAARPLLHREDGYVLVHAGVPPGLKLGEAEKLAADAGGVLASGKRRELLASLYKGRSSPNPRFEGPDRLRAIADALTQIRTVRADGEMCRSFKGPPGEAPSGCRPWFELVPSSEPTRIVFGHWARLGLYMDERFVGLDTGCAWGGPLTAVRLEDRRVFQEPSELA